MRRPIDHRRPDNIYMIIVLFLNGHAKFDIDLARDIGHKAGMKDAATLLDALVRRGVTQKQIAEAIGITQPNANKLYRPDRNGRLRTLSYDEGQNLIERFGLADDAAAGDHAAFNAATLAPILDALLPLAPSGGRSEKSLELLSQALAYGLALLGTPTARPPSPDAIGVAARGAVARFREIGQA